MLQFVQVISQVGIARLQPLALLGLLHNLVGLGSIVQRVAGHHLPVVEHALGERLTTGVGSQVSSEAWKMAEL